MSLSLTQNSYKWITSASYDLLFYIGACITSYVLIYAHLGLGISALFLWWLWIITVDGPHVFGTISRTYLDRSEWQHRRKLFLHALLWFLPGPIAIGIGLALNSRFTLLAFLLFAQLWAYWHVVRQHYGFMVLYQKKNGESNGKQNRVDYYCFYVVMIAPFLSFILRHPDARQLFGLGPALGMTEQLIVYSLHVVIAGAVMIYLIKEVRNATRADHWNLPKNLFLMACVPLHFVIFLHPYVSTHVDLILFAVFVTYYHNVQYHGIVWFYNRNRYQKSGNRESFGSAGLVSRHFLTYYACGLAFTLLYQYGSWMLTGMEVPFGIGPTALSDYSIGGLFKFKELIVALWWGFAFNHYYLDQHIWRLSRDKQLNQELKLELKPAL